MILEKLFLKCAAVRSQIITSTKLGGICECSECNWYETFVVVNVVNVTGMKLV